MDPTDSKVLKKKYKYLVDNLDFKDFCDQLIEDEILTTDMCEEINAEKTRKDKVRQFLAFLPKRGPNAYSAFIKALGEENAHVVKELEDFKKTLISPAGGAGGHAVQETGGASLDLAITTEAVQPQSHAGVMDTTDIGPCNWWDCLTDDIKETGISTQKIAKLSLALGNIWEQVALLLGFNQTKIEQWKASNPHNAKVWPMYMLSEWVNKYPERATVGFLIDVLKDAGITDENVYCCFLP